MSVDLSKTNDRRPRCYEVAPVEERYGMLRPIVYISAQGWLCACDCGNKRIVDGYNLRKGKTKSCGCMRSGGVNDPRDDGRRFKSKNNRYDYQLKVPTFPKYGTRCWVCRNKTGVKELVALCKVCRDISHGKGKAK